MATPLGDRLLHSRPMIYGAHFLLYTADADADRAFFRDVLGYSFVDAHDGWLIFALPPAEIGVHPLDEGGLSNSPDTGVAPIALFLMCDDVQESVQTLAAKGVSCAAPEQAPWGVFTTLTLPGGGKLGLYQPRHPVALKR